MSLIYSVAKQIIGGKSVFLLRVKVKVWHNDEDEDKCGLDEPERVGFVSIALVSCASFVDPYYKLISTIKGAKFF